MNRRIKHKIWTNLDNPKMHYSIRQILVATKGLFLTPLHMPDGNRYYMSHFCGKVTKYEKQN